MSKESQIRSRVVLLTLVSALPLFVFAVALAWRLHEADPGAGGIVSLIGLYAASGRNAAHGAGDDGGGHGAIELRTPTANKWYARVPETPGAADGEPAHVIGDEDD